MKKAVIIVLAVMLVAGAGYYAFSRYLVSRLDGTGGVQAPQENLHTYNSPELGLSFKYLSRFEPVLHNSSKAGEESYTVVLLPVGYIPPQGGEGPPAIAIAAYPNTEGLTLGQWVRADARSNFKLSPGALATTTLDGHFALAYRYSGLYETDALAVAVGSKVYVFSVGWLDASDELRADFSRLLTSVEFK
jgi:hypothetical protein